MLRNGHKFAKALTGEMKAAGKTKADVARAIAVNSTTVYSWLNGAEPSDSNFDKLVKLFPALAEFAR